MNFKNIIFLFTVFVLLFSCKKKMAVKVDSVVQTQDTLKTEKVEDLIDEKEIIKVEEIIQPNWAKNAVIYELNIRQFSKEGTFNKVTEAIPRLKDMGVDVLWLMPIHPIGKKNKKGELGSYYSVKNYKEVNPNYGSLEDFKKLVETAHNSGIKVLLDWVANHTSQDNIWIKENENFYTKDSLGNFPIIPKDTDWTDVAELDYNNSEMRLAMQEAMIFWLKETDIDGFRCDVAELVPLDFWIDTRSKLDSIKPVFMLAESANPEFHKAFNLTYGWDFMNLILSIAKKEKGFQDFKSYLEERNIKYKPNDIIMYFTTNHDENSWSYIESETFGNNLKNFSVLTYAMGGMPLIYSGQESGLDKKLKFFEKDTIVWNDYKNQEFYKNMNLLYKNNKSLWNCTEWADFEFIKANENTFNFIKSKGDNMLAILQNYSKHSQYVSKISLNGFDTSVNLINGEAVKIDEKGIEVPAHSTIIIGKNQ